jgi:hypothetical protein
VLLVVLFCGHFVVVQELLSLELYLSVEKGNPEWLELPDESHIFHKALYDGLNQAVQQLYAEAGRVLPGPGEVSDLVHQSPVTSNAVVYPAAQCSLCFAPKRSENMSHSM